MGDSRGQLIEVGIREYDREHYRKLILLFYSEKRNQIIGDVFFVVVTILFLLKVFFVRAPGTTIFDICLEMIIIYYIFMWFLTTIMRRYNLRNIDKVYSYEGERTIMFYEKGFEGTWPTVSDKPLFFPYIHCRYMKYNDLGLIMVFKKKDLKGKNRSVAVFVEKETELYNDIFYELVSFLPKQRIFKCKDCK